MNFPCWRSRGAAFGDSAEHRREQPQALLISGDIYDKPVPPTEAVKLLDDFLTEVSKRGLHTYLIAGNHDSAQRLEFGKEIFGRESIHISGSIGEGLAHVTEMDEYGTVEIWLLPFSSRRM